MTAVLVISAFALGAGACGLAVWFVQSRNLPGPGAHTGPMLAVPASRSDAGAAVPSDGLPVLGDRMLSEVRAERDAHRRARQHADIMHAGYARAVDRIRQEAGLPTAEEMRAGYFGLPRRTPGATLPYVEPLTDRGPGCPPWETGSMPVYAEVPVATVLEAERLAKVMQP